MPIHTVSSPALPDVRQPQLFLDNTWVADSQNVERVWHQARKYPEPVLRASMSHEEEGVLMYGSTHYIDGLFRMWYRPWAAHFGGSVCYAESGDGIHWRKPIVKLHDFAGSRENNVLIPPQTTDGGGVDNFTLIDDREHDAAWPYKLLYWQRVAGVARNKRGCMGIFAARSKDGIAFEPIGKGPVLPDWADRFNALPTRLDGRFVVFGRSPASMDLWFRNNHGRRVWRSESDDLRKWSKPEFVLAADVEDPAPMEIYSISAWQYRDLLLGGIERMFMSPDVLDVEIAWSRDGGRDWQRSQKRPRFIPMPPENAGSFDSRWTNVGASPSIVHNNQLYFYYSGRTGAHASPPPHKYGAIGLATLRIDGFASLAAKQARGWLQTPSFTWPGGDLMANVDPRLDLQAHPNHNQGGEVLVTVLDARGKPIKGYAAADCVGIRTNTWQYAGNASAAMKWQGDRSMAALKGRKVSLLFDMRCAHLYSFHAGKASA